MDLELKDKVAIVTGGSLGIGLAVAEALAQCARDEERVQQVGKQITDKFGVRVVATQADVSKSEDIDHFVKVVEEAFGNTDILINNAGMRWWQRSHSARCLCLARWCQPCPAFSSGSAS